MLALQRIYKSTCSQRRNRTVGGSRCNLANLLGTAIACDEDAAVGLGGAILTCDNVAAKVKVNRTAERLVGDKAGQSSPDIAYVEKEHPPAGYCDRKD